MNVSVFWDVILGWVTGYRCLDGILKFKWTKKECSSLCQLTNLVSAARRKILLLDARNPFCSLAALCLFFLPSGQHCGRLYLYRSATCQSQVVAWGVTVGHYCHSGLIEISFTYSGKKILSVSPTPVLQRCTK